MKQGFVGRIKTIPKPSWFKVYGNLSYQRLGKLSVLYRYAQKAVYCSTPSSLAVHTNGLILKVMLIVLLLNLSIHPCRPGPQFFDYVGEPVNSPCP